MLIKTKSWFLISGGNEKKKDTMEERRKIVFWISRISCSACRGCEVLENQPQDLKGKAWNGGLVVELKTRGSSSWSDFADGWMVHNQKLPERGPRREGRHDPRLTERHGLKRAFASETGRRQGRDWSRSPELRNKTPK